MKVLLIGATGNLGIRLVAALLTHGHSVVAFVRSSNKLESLLPTSVYRQIAVVQGDATDPISIERAILDASCDAIVNTAGLAALPPWGKSELPAIFHAVLDAVREAGLERKKPLRAWFLAGLGVLYYPGSEWMLSNYVPIYLEHRQNLHLLKSLPPNTLDWSMLCPSTMTPESSDINVPTKTLHGKLVANAMTPPSWQDSWIKYIPLVGKTLLCAMNAGRYETTLEQNAEFIASDLESYGSRWSGMTVGVIDESKMYTTEVMQEVDDGDDYSDDDLDALPVDTFHQLQQNAIQSTQQPKGYGARGRPGAKLPEVSNPAGQPADFKKSANDSNHSHIWSRPQQLSSDYGDFDDEMLDGEIFDAAEEPGPVAGVQRAIMSNPNGESISSEGFRQSRFVAPSQLRGYGKDQYTLSSRLAPNVLQRNEERFDDHAESNLPARDGIYGPGAQPEQESEEVNILQAQVQKLLRERDTLQKAVNSANELVSSKTGEIAIIRANQSKAEKEYEQRMVALQKLRADEAAKHKIEVEKARAEQEKTAIEKRFLENDLNQGTEKIKNLQRVVKDGSGRTTISKPEDRKTHLATPRKNRSLPFGDGFNDDEIQLTSPSKLSIRPKLTTPKAAGKRKRKPEENSPAKPLPLNQPNEDEQLDQAIQQVRDAHSTSIPRPPDQDSQNFKFTQKILNHRVKRNEKRSFEALAAFAYPSNPTQALSTIFLDKLSVLSVKREIQNFPAAVGTIIVSLWSQCIDEKYFPPVHLLMDLVKFILLISPPGIGPSLPDDVIKYAQLTADVNLIPRFQGAPASQIESQTDSNLCLQILHLMAFDCLPKTEDIEWFWRSMRFDFVIMMLSGAQPMDEIRVAMTFLQTSVLETSFAMRIAPGDGTQGKSQEHVIERLTRLLIQVPRVVEGAKPYTATEVSQLRLHVLDLLEAMCEEKHCGEALATHKDVIGRLVRVMNDELDALYDHHYGHEYRSELVNKSTRLLFYLTSSYSSLIDMQAKLSVIPGGSHKALIALTRLAFSEGIFYEKDIDEGVSDCAHQMLEKMVNPQEAESLLEVFSSNRNGDA